MGKKKSGGGASASKAWKNSAAYKNGSGGSDYAKKRDSKPAKPADDFTVAASPLYDPFAPFSKVSRLSRPTVEYVDHQPVARAPEKTHTRGLYETEAYRGGGAQKAYFLGATFPPVENQNLKFKPCFFTGRVVDDETVVITRYVGYVHKGEFSGEKLELPALNGGLGKYVLEDRLQEWCANQSGENRARQDSLHRDAKKVTSQRAFFTGYSRPGPLSAW